MSRKCYLFLPNRTGESIELNSVALSWVYEDSNSELKLAHGLLSDVVSTALHHNITVVIPGEDVLFLTAEVPGKNSQRVQQAVPYVLEDSVIDDVDDLYFAVSKSLSNYSDNQYDVSVINKQYFESIINQLEIASIHADIMIADYWLLPDTNNLFTDGERVIVNSPNLKFSSPSGGMINLNDYGLTDEQTVNVIDCGKEADAINIADKLIDNPNIKKECCDAHPLLCLVQNSTSAKGVNLLQGRYKKKKNWSQAGKTWLPVAALFLVWLSVQGGLFIVDYISLSKKNATLNAEIVKIYKTAFPQSRRIIDAKAQMLQKLKNLKKRKGQSGRSFSEMLSGSAGIFAKTRGLEIKSLRYYDGHINLELQIASLQDLDKLKNELNKEKGYQVEIQNASSGKEKVTARLQIIGAES
jgi:general secretion pathway protein L